MAHPPRELTPSASPRHYFGAELRRLREQAGLSAAQLGDRVHYSGDLISKIEKAERWPKPALTAALDEALNAKGALTRLLPLVEADGGATGKGEADSTSAEEPVAASAHATTQFLATIGRSKLDGLVLQQLDDDVERLSIDSLTSPPRVVLVNALRLRDDVYRALVANHHPAELTALHLAHARLSGLLAYASLDLNDGYTAMAHTRAALLSTSIVGDHALEAWVRGTQSLIARFQGRFSDALDLARAGRSLRAGGTSGVRLWCAEAQCLAQLGDTRGTLHALDAARDELHRLDGMTPEPGVFAFPAWKLSYYAGSSLIWLPGDEHAHAASLELRSAISGLGDERSNGYSWADRILASIYQATAYLLSRDLDAAQHTLKTVLRLSSGSMTSWHARRLERVESLLRGSHYRDSPTARDMAAEIEGRRHEG